MEKWMLAVFPMAYPLSRLVAMNAALLYLFCFACNFAHRLSGCDTSCSPPRVGLIDPCHYLYSNEYFWLPLKALMVNHRFNDL